MAWKNHPNKEMDGLIERILNAPADTDLFDVPFSDIQTLARECRIFARMNDDHRHACDSDMPIYRGRFVD